MTSFEAVGEGGFTQNHPQCFRGVLWERDHNEVITGKTEIWMSWKIGHLAYNDFPNLTHCPALTSGFPQKLYNFNIVIFLLTWKTTP